MISNNRTGAQLLASRDNLQSALLEQEAKAIHEEENGSCRCCQRDTIVPGPVECAKCINGAGKEKNFIKKERRKKCQII